GLQKSLPRGYADQLALVPSGMGILGSWRRGPVAPSGGRADALGIRRTGTDSGERRTGERGNQLVVVTSTPWASPGDSFPLRGGDDRRWSRVEHVLAQRLRIGKACPLLNSYVIILMLTA